MSSLVYRYQFPSEIPFVDIEAGVVLALFATCSLHGESQTRMDAAHVVFEESRTVVIEADTDVGRDLNRLFCGFVTREFGENAFDVERFACEAESASGKPYFSQN